MPLFAEVLECEVAAEAEADERHGRIGLVEDVIDHEGEIVGLAAVVGGDLPVRFAAAAPEV